MSEYIDRLVNSYGRLLGATDAACANLLTTTDLAEVRRIAEHLERVRHECSEASKLEGDEHVD